MGAMFARTSRPQSRQTAAATRRQSGPRPQGAPAVGMPLFLQCAVETSPRRAREATLRQSGQPLPGSVRTSFESQMGTDLSHVRLHTDARASEATQSVQAKSYTLGNDIVFGQGQYVPETQEGRRLLGHELMHVAQQAVGPVPGHPIGGGMALSTPTDTAEQEAEQAADVMVTGRQEMSASLPPSVSQQAASGGHGGTIQRQEDDEEQWQFNLLPPRLRGPLGPLGFSADTSAAQLGYTGEGFSAGLGYKYGSEIFGTARFGDFSSRLGVDPSSGAFSLGGSYDRFRFGLRGSPTGAFGASLGYGSGLLPFPHQLSSTMYQGAAGLHGVAGSLPAFLNDPLGTYGAQSENIDAMIAAGKMLGTIAGHPSEGPNFGAGLQLGWDPALGWTIFGGAQGRF